MAETTSPVRAQRTATPSNDSAPQQAAASTGGTDLLEERGPGRPPRVPLGTQRQKMQFSERPGFKRRVMNDVGDRIEQAKRAWWDHVRDPQTGQPIKMTVGVAKEGGALNGYLMEIPIEYYNEDVLAKDEPLKLFDSAIRRGEVGNQDGRYPVVDAYGKPKIDIKTGR